MGGSAIPNISQDMLTKLSGDRRVTDLAKKYGYTIPKTLPASTATPASAPFSWQFPQYSQTWAFTPPTPTPYMNPPPFNAATLSKPSSGSGSKSSGGSSRSSSGKQPDLGLGPWDARGYPGIGG